MLIFKLIANNKNNIPENISNSKYLGLILLEQYLHFPPKKI